MTGDTKDGVFGYSVARVDEHQWRVTWIGGTLNGVTIESGEVVCDELTRFRTTDLLKRYGFQLWG